MDTLCIDLGTTNSLASAVLNNEVVLIHNELGSTITPTVVYYGKNNIYIGELARRKLLLDPENTVYEAKRFVGTSFEEIIEETKYVSYKVVKDKNGETVFAIPNAKKLVKPEEVLALVLQYLRNSAQNYLNHNPSKAIIGVPAYFNEKRKKAIKTAGELAGFSEVTLVNEPTAGLFTYNLHRRDGIYIVFDWGGGTLDVSVVKVEKENIEVLSYAGEPHLGGSNIDEALIQKMLEEIKQNYNVDVSKDRSILSMLKDACEKAKKDLSFIEETEISILHIKPNVHFQRKITRKELEQIISPFTEKALQTIKTAIELAGIKKEDISAVVLSGGSSRIPLIQNQITKLLNKPLLNQVPTEEVVAIGLAKYYQNVYENKKVKVIEINPLSLGIELHGGLFHVLIPRGAPLPFRKCELFTTSKDNQTQIEIHVLQGERPIAKFNYSLEKFYINVTPAPRGVPKIEVCFDLNEEGLLSIYAKDLATKEEKVVKVKPPELDFKEIEEILESAKQNKEEDEKLKELIQAKNELEKLLDKLNKLFASNSTLLPEHVKGNANDLLETGKELLKTKDVEKLQKIQNIIKQIKELVSLTQTMLGFSTTTKNAS